MRLHIDRGVLPSQVAVPSKKPPTSSDTGDAESPDEAKRFQSTITRIVLEGAPASQLRALIDECHTWLKTQPHGQHGDLRASFLLVYNLTETQRKWAAETQALAGARSECESLRAQVESEREDAERKYQNLLRTSADERETALAVEKSLRQHYEQLDAEWRGKYEVAVTECRILHQDLKRFRHVYSSLPDPPRSIEARFFDEQPHVASQDTIVDSPDSMSVLKAKAMMNEDMFHLSPLPAEIPPFPSAIQTFAPLADDEEDFNMKDTNTTDTSDIRPYPLRTLTEPIPISSSKPRSGIRPVSIPARYDAASSGISRSLPRGYDVSTHSRPPSPPGRTSSAAIPHTRSDWKYHSYSRERHDQSHQRERWRAKLYDLLDSPASTSSSSLSRSSSGDVPRTRSSSTASSSAQQTAVPTAAASPTKPSSTSQPTNMVLSQTSGASDLAASQRGDIKRPVISHTPMSHASSAAMALEKERQRVDQEKQRPAQGTSGSQKEKDAYGSQRYRSSKGKLPSVSAGGIFT